MASATTPVATDAANAPSTTNIRPPSSEQPSANNDNVPINSKDRVDPQLRPVLRRCPPTTFNSRWKVRTFNALMHLPGPASSGVKSTRIKSIGRLYYPVDGAGAPTSSHHGNHRTTVSAVLWLHGGGRMMGSASGATETTVCSRIVRRLNVEVLSASYRLAPRHPFPAALDDAVAAYKWLVRRLKAEVRHGEVDVRIAVAGESSGGGLAAELCQRLLDESVGRGASSRNSSSSSRSSIPLPVAQLLLYPMLDDRTCLDEAKKRQCPPHFVWNHTSNVYGWSCYLGSDTKPGADILPKYAAAARREDLSNLPPAWIVVGELDLFRDECEEYARRLESHGVETRYVMVVGGFHGFLTLGKKEAPVLKAWKDFEEFGRHHLFVED